MAERRGPPPIENLYTLKVDNIDFRTTTDTLKDIFGKYGELGDVYIPRNFQTNQPRGFAFVRFVNKADGEEAQRVTDQTEVEGRTITVSEALKGRTENTRRDNDRRGGGGYGGRDQYRDDRGYGGGRGDYDRDPYPRGGGGGGGYGRDDYGGRGGGRDDYGGRGGGRYDDYGGRGGGRDYDRGPRYDDRGRDSYRDGDRGYGGRGGGGGGGSRDDADGRRAPAADRSRSRDRDRDRERDRAPGSDYLA